MEYQLIEKSPPFKNGKQGYVGLFQDKTTLQKYIFKFSQYINYLVLHESIVMKGLLEIAPFCPHFCRYHDQISLPVNPRKRKESNPFEIDCKYPIRQDVLISEYIQDAPNFFEYIRTLNIDDKEIFSIVQQVCMGILIAQKFKRFTHYDLHSMNILISTCNRDTVFLYVIDEKNQFCIPTYGNYPRIIDFGFSYIEDMEDGPLWPSMGHTEVGFTSYRYDRLADLKLFLLSVSYEINQERKNWRTRKFRSNVKKLFESLPVETTSGWNKTSKETISIADLLLSRLQNTREESKSILFTQHEDYAFDLLQTLIILPLQKQDFSQLSFYMKIWLQEWIKIEHVISSPFYTLYILKGIVDSARVLHADYLDSSRRKHTVRLFKKAVYEKISEVSQYVSLKHLNFEKLLCSLYMLTKAMEGFFFHFTEKLRRQQETLYQTIKFHHNEEIFAFLDQILNLPPYQFNSNSKIYIFDCIQKTTNTLSELSSEALTQLNQTHPLCQGTYIYQNIYNTPEP